jgi:hypothetical protein
MTSTPIPHPSWVIAARRAFSIEDQIIAEALTAKGQDAVWEITRRRAADEGFTPDEADQLGAEADYLHAKANRPLGETTVFPVPAYMQIYRTPPP